MKFKTWGFIITLLSVSIIITAVFAEDVPYLKIKCINSHSVQTICSGGKNLIGALFNDEQVLVELKTVPITNGEANIEFNKSTNDYNLKLLLWNNNITPVSTPCIRRALNLQLKGDYDKIEDNEIIIYSFTDNDNNPMTISFDNDCPDISISFDFKIENISADGAIVGMLPYNNNVAGCGVGFCRDENDVRFIPNTTIIDTPFQLLNYSNFKNQWIHIVLTYSNGVAKTTYSDPINNIVYVDDKSIPILYGIGSDKPINKLSFGTVFNGSLTAPPANTSFCIRNFNIERQ